MEDGREDGGMAEERRASGKKRKSASAQRERVWKPMGKRNVMYDTLKEGLIQNR